MCKKIRGQRTPSLFESSVSRRQFIARRRVGVLPRRLQRLPNVAAGHPPADFHAQGYRRGGRRGGRGVHVVRSRRTAAPPPPPTGLSMQSRGEPVSELSLATCLPQPVAAAPPATRGSGRWARRSCTGSREAPLPSGRQPSGWAVQRQQPARPGTTVCRRWPSLPAAGARAGGVAHPPVRRRHRVGRGRARARRRRSAPPPREMDKGGRCHPWVAGRGGGGTGAPSCRPPGSSFIGGGGVAGAHRPSAVSPPRGGGGRAGGCILSRGRGGEWMALTANTSRPSLPLANGSRLRPSHRRTSIQAPL